MATDAPRVAHAKALQARIRGLLDTAGLPDVTVTLNALEILSGSRHGVIVITPPDLTFTTWTMTDVVHELDVIAGPADNMLAAWETLDPILEALRPLNLDTARTDMYPMKGASPLPGYVVTLNPDTIED